MTRGDGKVVMEYVTPEGERIVERVYPCEANDWLVAHDRPRQPHAFGEITRHYHEDAHREGTETT